MQKKVNFITCEYDKQDIEYLVCHIANLWRRLVSVKIKSLGVTGTEKRVLFTIARNPGLTQVQVASLLDLEPQNLIRFLDRLESQHWIEKKPNPEDRRVKCLYVTENAQEIMAQIKALSHRLKPQILDGIPKQQLQDLIEKLQVIRENLLTELEADEEKT